MIIYVVRTNSMSSCFDNDFILYTDYEEAKKMFESICREYQENYNLPEEAVEKCLKLKYLHVGSICEHYDLDGSKENDFCALEEIPVGVWTDNQTSSTYFDFSEVDDLIADLERKNEED